jgi:hypothetical protein
VGNWVLDVGRREWHQGSADLRMQIGEQSAQVSSMVWRVGKSMGAYRSIIDGD